MKSKVFSTRKGVPTDHVNDAGGVAYKLSDEAALAQYAVTGTFNDTYYAGAQTQLDRLIELAAKCSSEYIAKTAVYARQKGYMKDMPAALCAVLHGRGKEGLKHLKVVFPRVIDNGRMLRGFVQMVRSGVFGRKSFGTATKRLIREWLEGRTDEQIFKDSVGNDPSIVDVIKMVHPKPAKASRNALYGYLLGKKYNKRYLPKLVKDYEKFKAGKSKEVPDVPFQMLTAASPGPEVWYEIANNARWQMTRMNLNTFQRHGVLDDPKMVTKLAKRLADPENVRRARAFPYQLMMAYHAFSGDMRLQNALQDALDVAVENVPAIPGKVFVCVDVSGSMGSPVTGHRRGATTNVACYQVACLMAAAIVKKNPDTEVLVFDTQVYQQRLNPRDSVITIAKQLFRNGGGTAISAPLQTLNQAKARGDAVIIISDMETWADRHSGWWYNGTTLAQEWQKFKSRNKKARMVLIDLQVGDHTQMPEQRPDTLHVGGFSDQVFNLVAMYVETGSADGLRDAVNEVDLSVDISARNAA